MSPTKKKAKARKKSAQKRTREESNVRSRLPHPGRRGHGEKLWRNAEAMWIAGKCSQDIARALGVNAATVRSKAEAEGWNESLVARLVREEVDTYKQGMKELAITAGDENRAVHAKLGRQMMGKGATHLGSAEKLKPHEAIRAIEVGANINRAATWGAQAIIEHKISGQIGVLAQRLERSIVDVVDDLAERSGLNQDQADELVGRVVGLLSEAAGLDPGAKLVESTAEEVKE